MENRIQEVCDCTISNYRYAVRNLRYDGDYINHYSALMNGYYKKSINDKEIKEIRTYIRKNTPNISVLRGDILYIVSFLIGLCDGNKIGFCDEIIETLKMLIDFGFKECGYLVFVSYSLVKYCDKKDRQDRIKRTRNIFIVMKQKYGNLTTEDDYLLCALLALNGKDFENILEHGDSMFKSMHDLRMFSDNGAQCLTNSMMLNENENISKNVSEFLLKLKTKGVKIGRQFLHMIGIMVNNQDLDKSIEEMDEVIEYLRNEESEYSFYIDKDFRNMIAFMIVFMDCDKYKIKYADELLAFGTYAFILSKNQGVLNEVLA
ncbi:MAG: DUF4003 family protein [Clostridium butyricum]|nr:DUF4003 family protein [Clostridium butyricum]